MPLKRMPLVAVLLVGLGVAFEARATGAPPGWFDVIAGLRVGRVDDAGAPPASATEVVGALRSAGATLACDGLVYRQTERGELEASCEGRWLVEQTHVQVALTFVQQGATTRLSSMTVSALQDGEAWRRRMLRELTSRFGPGTRTATAQTWRAQSRLFALHDPSLAPCGGLCVPFLWLSDAAHPQLEARGFLR